jgi:hypothetical protein
VAQEITTSQTLSVSKGNLQFAKSINNKIDMTGNTYAGGAFTVPTTTGGTALPMGSVSTAGVTIFRNTEPSGGNFVTVGIQVSGTFYPYQKLLPGEGAQLRLGTNAPYALADTADIVLEYVILEE